jgi:hypothetical protein
MRRKSNRGRVLRPAPTAPVPTSTFATRHNPALGISRISRPAFTDFGRITRYPDKKPGLDSYRDIDRNRMKGFEKCR